MITIESHHIMDIIRNKCPVSIKGSLNRITILPPKSWDSAFGVIRFETSEGEQLVDACWFIDVMSDGTFLTIVYPVVGNPIRIEL